MHRSLLNLCWCKDPITLMSSDSTVHHFGMVFSAYFESIAHGVMFSGEVVGVRWG